MGEHVKGPWYWVKYPKTKTVRLMGQNQLIVMDFARWGMQSAQPRFIRIVPREMELMINAENIDLDCDANARLIAAAPDLLDACEAAYRELFHLFLNPGEGPSETIMSVMESAINKARGGRK